MGLSVGLEFDLDVAHQEMKQSELNERNRVSLTNITRDDFKSDCPSPLAAWKYRIDLRGK